ncbi:hypothetical protein AVEN_270541-1 [Araneus ventricosus]|uniref:Uncharacterized protein n=1 Tax=Araneus ventricosus TaxID=182803 RepID=A0A4Y2B653_ARAVE|nr:hypothetical protein AVEN_270541-1 [Araneus ventricosus]
MKKNLEVGGTDGVPLPLKGLTPNCSLRSVWLLEVFLKFLQEEHKWEPVSSEIPAGGQAARIYYISVRHPRYMPPRLQSPTEDATFHLLSRVLDSWTWLDILFSNGFHFRTILHRKGMSGNESYEHISGILC